MSFVHLHTHSHYSLLDGLAKIDQLVERATELKLPALALTDHGVMYGLVEFYQKARAAGLKPILGVEAYVARGSAADKTPANDRPYHLTLLARTLEGYRNLVKLTTFAHLEGFYYKPRIDKELLAKHADGLIILTGCLNGELAQLLLAGKRDEAISLMEFYTKAVGHQHVFLEVQDRPTLSNQAAVNEHIFALAKELDLPVVATNDSHYARPDDAMAQDTLLCIQTKRRLADSDRMSYQGEDLSVKSPAAMAESFADHPEAIANSLKIADMVDCELPLGHIMLPHYDLPKGQTADGFLRQLCLEGLPRRYSLKSADLEKSEQGKIIRERLDYELGVIAKTGFAPYFLIVQDFINWAKNNGIVVGPGRGSAAGSIVAYLTNITNIDPLKYDLLFERFLNPERVSMPDIDIDFADTRRDEVIRYVEGKYGKDHVSQIITFGTMAARAAVRDVGRVMGLSYTYCDRVAKLIPMFTKLDEAIATIPELKEIYENDDEGRQLLDAAKKLEGVVRHASTHACGVVITKNPLDDHVPIQHASNDDGTVITQYDLHAVEDLGLLKMDFLGLKNLTILEKVILYIEKVRDQKVNLDELPLNDKKTFKLLQQAKTTGVFQLESSGMKRYLKQLKPTSLEDIIAMVSLYRPGPMELIPDFIAGKHGLKKTTYLHPKLQPILEKTYGVAVYQEQVLQMARDLAGFTLGEADVLRKAVGKKIAKLLNEQRAKFVSGCMTNNIDQKTAERIFSFIEPFARYGFNRAHAACYAMIAYQTAYFKANYPVEFMASLLSSDEENTDRIAVEVSECRGMGIEVLAPDVNESYSTFTVVKEALATDTPRIRFGLKAIKNVGSNCVNAIIAERKAHGPYQSLEDFLRRINYQTMNKKSLESLIKSGALDLFGERNALLTNLEALLAYCRQAAEEKASGQHSLFGTSDVAPKLRLVPAPPVENDERLAWEKNLLGLYISHHPYADFAPHLESLTVPIAELGEHKRDKKIIIGGVVSAVKKILTKNGEPMLFVSLEDLTGTTEVVVFPSILKDQPAVWQEDRCLLIQGRVSEKSGALNILADRGVLVAADRIAEAMTAIGGQTAGLNNAPPIDINVPATAERQLFEDLKTILRHYPGRHPVRLIINGGDQPKTIMTSISVQPSAEAIQRVEALMGASTVHQS